jgi:hypothetical protein
VLASALLLRRMLRLNTVHDVVFEVEGEGPLPERRSTNRAKLCLAEACALPPEVSRVTDAPLRGRGMHRYARRSSSWPIKFHVFALSDAQAV